MPLIIRNPSTNTPVALIVTEEEYHRLRIHQDRDTAALRPGDAEYGSTLIGYNNAQLRARFQGLPVYVLPRPLAPGNVERRVVSFGSSRPKHRDHSSPMSRWRRYRLWWERFFSFLRLLLAVIMDESRRHNRSGSNGSGASSSSGTSSTPTASDRDARR